MKIRLKIEYDGTDFFGWQVQGDLPTIQLHLETALLTITGKRVVVFGSGRTDSGAHAKAQIAHFQTDSVIEPQKWRLALNTLLPRAIRVLESTEVPMDFHAQKSAIGKTYEYRILNRSVGSALDRRVYFFPHKVDWEAAKCALPYFLGEKDFRSFQGAKADVLTTVRSIFSFDLEREGPESDIYRFTVEGSGFLKQMVRTMVGTVLEVGLGKRAHEDIPDIIAACDRTFAGRTVPASGLCLVSVKYL